MALTGAVVEFVGDPVAVVVGDVGHVRALGDVLADQSVGVFIGSALPGVVGLGEVEA